MANEPAPGGAKTEWLSAGEVARRLGIRKETVYSYVSRGLITSRRAEGRRESRFDANEVARLAARERRGGGRAGALEVIVDSGLTLLDADDELWYRGWSATEASRTASFEQVALWLFGASREPLDPAGPFVADSDVVERARRGAGLAPARATPLDRYLIALAAAASADPLRNGREPSAVAARGSRIIALLVDSLPPAGDPLPSPGAGVAPARVAERLWRALSPLVPSDRQVHALDAALVLLADHELATSTLAARVAASTWADIYRVVLAGMATLGGPLHGGVGDLTLQLLREAVSDGAARAVGRRLASGERIPGFGHVVYRNRDPRADALIAEVRTAWPRNEIVAAAGDVIEAVRAEHPGVFPNIDLATATLVGAAQMIEGSSEAIFATARTAGWIAHAIEEYGHALRYRTRAAYTGPEPGGPISAVRTSTAG